MHGVPKNLRTRAFHGKILLAVQDLETITYLRFGSSPDPEPANQISIGVEGRWELSGSNSGATAGGDPKPTSAALSLAPIGDVVSASSIDAPRSFTLLFSRGASLTVFDSNSSVESFSVPELNVYV